jgi:two-component system, cell cycle sensor histidine kinase and response regulator CckA
MSTTLHLLILEDSSYDAELEIAELEEAGYLCEWERVETRADFLACLETPDYDLILADYSLPTFDGLAALRLVLELDLDLPFVLVSGTLGEEWAIESLKAGATDYVMKTRLSRLGPVVKRALREKEEQRRLKQAEVEIARLATVVEQSPVTIVITDLEGDIVYANPDFETSTGYPVAEALGQNPRFLRSDRQDAQFYQELWDTVAAGDTWNGVFVNKRKDGELYHEEATVFPIRDAGGEIINYAAVKRDVTERKQAEEALRLTQSSVDNSTDAVYWMGPDAKLTYVNRAAVEAWGYPREELLTMTVHDISPRFPPEVWPAHWARLREERSMVIHTEHQRQDGSTFPVEITVNLIQFGGREITCAMARDITERVRRAEELERLLAQIHGQAQQLSEVMSTVPEGVLLLDAAGRVILANPVAEGDLIVLADAKGGDIPRPGSGQAITHLGGRPLAELLTSPPTGGLWHEVKAEDRTFEIIARPMENLPEPENWVLVIRDVTRERESERRIQQQERLAAVGQLAAGIAHDFNNIMAVIVLYTQMGLRLPGIPDQLRDRLQVVDRQAARATDLIQQILDFSRRAVLERRPMDLTPFLKEIVKLLERTVPESIRMEFTYGAGEYTVNADPTRVQQALMNLVLNARDAMLPKGGGELHVALSRAAPTDEINCVICGEVTEGDWVRIQVTDTGSGIPPQVLTHIFEPFYTTKDVGKGTGLGLAQVYGIVKQHEGHTDVTTEVGAGTTFTLYLPALLGRQPEAQALETRGSVQGQGETILVVEDNADLRKAMVESVKWLNYRVREAADGREALDILGQGGSEIALVLSDLVMPEMGGAALFHTMRQRGLMLPMVMLSGHPMKKEMADLQAQGLAGWMLKPPNLAQLSQLLARALEK